MQKNANLLDLILSYRIPILAFVFSLPHRLGTPFTPMGTLGPSWVRWHFITDRFELCSESDLTALWRCLALVCHLTLNKVLKCLSHVGGTPKHLHPPLHPKMLPSDRLDLFPGQSTNQFADSRGGSIPTGYNQGWTAASDYHGDDASGTWHPHHAQAMTEASPIPMLGLQSNVPSFEASTHRRVPRSDCILTYPSLNLTDQEGMKLFKGPAAAANVLAREAARVRSSILVYNATKPSHVPRTLNGT